MYWEKWAKDVAKIAKDQISRIKHLITTQPEHKEAFDTFQQSNEWKFYKYMEISTHL